ncbi:MAG: SIMPL domain-containing protein [Candidatus Nomurabacteria bacterium]|nr:SIMPL domain-containing protein [Candidatus Nomurabacteria bacterium]
MDTLFTNKNFIKVSTIFICLLCLLAIVSIFGSISGRNRNNLESKNTITFEGKGEVSAVPDIATINFTIRENQPILKDAQDKVTKKEGVLLAFLDLKKVAKVDIKTENYSSYPKYDYNTPCYQGSGVSTKMGMPCRSEPKLIGYEVSEYVSVKIHDISQSGDIVKGIGALGVSEMNGPNFSINNEDQLKETARKIAIDDAKAKAQKLAGDLGVHLVGIVSFSENGNYPMPMMYAKGLATDASLSVSSPSPELPAGQNKITSNVSITYEIR